MDSRTSGSPWAPGKSLSGHWIYPLTVHLGRILLADSYRPLRYGLCVMW